MTDSPDGSGDEFSTFQPFTPLPSRFDDGGVNSTVSPRDAGATTSAALDATAPPGVDVVLVVGATCGAVGLVLGVVVGVVVWTYCRHKRRRGNGKTTAVSKNPPEMTFEPLDLSLTLPSYGHMSAPERQQEAAGRDQRSASPSTHRSVTNEHAAVVDVYPGGSYHGFEPPTPPEPIHRVGGAMADAVVRDEMTKKGAEEQQRRLGELRGSTSLHSSVDTEIRPPSLTTRDSFSSGRGTGTESDTLTSEASRYGGKLLHRGRFDDPTPRHRSDDPHFTRSRCDDPPPRRQPEVTKRQRNTTRGSTASSSCTSSSSGATGDSPTPMEPPPPPPPPVTTVIDEEDELPTTDDDEVLSSYFDMYFSPSRQVAAKGDNSPPPTTRAKTDDSPRKAPVSFESVRRASDVIDL